MEHINPKNGDICHCGLSSPVSFCQPFKFCRFHSCKRPDCLLVGVRSYLESFNRIFLRFRLDFSTKSLLLVSISNRCACFFVNPKLSIISSFVFSISKGIMASLLKFSLHLLTPLFFTNLRFSLPKRLRCFIGLELSWKRNRCRFHQTGISRQ